MMEDQSEEKITKHEEQSSEMIKSDEEKKKKNKVLCDTCQYVNQFIHYGILEESEKGKEPT